MMRFCCAAAVENRRREPGYTFAEGFRVDCADCGAKWVLGYEGDKRVWVEVVNVTTGAKNA